MACRLRGRAIAQGPTQPHNGIEVNALTLRSSVN